MMSIKLRGDVDAIVSRFKNIREKQLPYALSRALNTTAEAVAEAERKEMKDVFDRPTPFTMDSLYVRRATKEKLVAKVGLKNFAGKGNPASKYLAAQISGGGRHLKRFERALQSVGAMPVGYRVVPGAAAKLDQYGNIAPSLIVQLLSYFQAFPEMGYKANMTDKRRATLAKGNAKKGVQGVSYFVGRPGGNSANFPLGIWARYGFSSGSAVKPVLIFVSSAQYEAIFDFFYVGKKTAGRVFKENFEFFLAEAMVTAKR